MSSSRDSSVQEADKATEAAVNEIRNGRPYVHPLNSHLIHKHVGFLTDEQKQQLRHEQAALLIRRGLAPQP